MAIVVAIIATLLYFSGELDGLMWALGLKAQPTREEHQRDCPKLPSALYYEYRLNRDPGRSVLLIVAVSPPDAMLPPEVEADILTRRDGEIGLRVPLYQVCGLARLPEVVQIIQERSPALP